MVLFRYITILEQTLSQKFDIEGILMKKYRKFVNINNLEVGMINARDIKSKGRILLKEGLPITEQVINKLRDAYFYSEIEVYCEDRNNLYENYQKNMKAIAQVEKNFIELSSDVQQIFQNMEYLQLSNVQEVRTFTTKIIEQLKSANLIIKNIVLYGSGNDAIYRHCVNVAALSTILGKWIGFNEQELNLLTYSAVLHDFGKVKINKDILDKLEVLTSKEFNLIKQHPVIGYNYIKQIKFLDKSVGLGVLMHHEKCDGSGYPLGLTGDKIHRFAKIIAISDVFDAINSDRLYKKSKRPFEALELIQEESLGKLDYEYSNVFLNHIVNYYMGENVLLNNGHLCKIIQVDVNNIDRPLLLDDNTFIDLKNEKNLYVEKLVL